MTRSLLAAILAGTLAAPLAAAPLLAPVDASATVDPGRAAIDAFAIAADANRDGRLSMVELESAGRVVFASMDVDADGAVTEAEMTGWRYGLADLAAFRGRAQAHDTAMGLVFDMMDRDRSGFVEAGEHRDGLARGWRNGDRDGDGRLSMAEFRDGFFITAALRRALTQ